MISFIDINQRIDSGYINQEKIHENIFVYPSLIKFVRDQERNNLGKKESNMDWLIPQNRYVEMIVLIVRCSNGRIREKDLCKWNSLLLKHSMIFGILSKRSVTFLFVEIKKTEESKHLCSPPFLHFWLSGIKKNNPTVSPISKRFGLFWFGAGNRTWTCTNRNDH